MGKNRNAPLDETIGVFGQRIEQYIAGIAGRVLAESC